MSVDAGFTLLVVGDRKNYHSLLVRQDRHRGFTLRRCASAADARERVGAEDIGLILIDAAAAELLEFCRELKNDPATVFLPVIALGDSQEQRLAAYSAGVDDFMSRIVHCDELVLRAEALVKLSRLRHMRTADQLAEEVERREEIRETFRRYVSPKLADKILSDAELNLGQLERPNRRTWATVMFADMRGFTGIAERLEPDAVVPLLNDYFALLTEVTFRHEGTVFNMAGDCLMVGFGVPLEQSDGAGRALAAGREMLARFQRLAGEWKLTHGIDTGIGIGINAGEVIAGNVGSPAYMSYTIIGDAVNVASRLSQRARAGEILVSGTVKRSLDELGAGAELMALPPFPLRGRCTSIDIFCLPLAQRLQIGGSGEAAA